MWARWRITSTGALHRGSGEMKACASNSPRQPQTSNPYRDETRATNPRSNNRNTLGLCLHQAGQGRLKAHQASSKRGQEVSRVRITSSHTSPQMTTLPTPAKLREFAERCNGEIIDAIRRTQPAKAAAFAEMQEMCIFLAQSSEADTSPFAGTAR